MSDNNDPRNEPEDKRVEENRIEAAKKLARAKVQARANTMDGGIDVEARGDVKGDGGDAKDYADDDPHKALGTPVYEYGLSETTATDEKSSNSETLFGGRISPRTQAEMDRGKKVLTDTKASRKGETRRATNTRTTVTDTKDDPDGDKGAAEAEKKAGKKDGKKG